MFDSNNIRTRKCYWTCRDKFQMIHKFCQLLINWMLAINDRIVQMLEFKRMDRFPGTGSTNQLYENGMRDACILYPHLSRFQDDVFSSATTHVCYISSYCYSHTTFHFPRVTDNNSLIVAKHQENIVDMCLVLRNITPSASIINQIIHFIFSHAKNTLCFSFHWSVLVLLQLCLSTDSN